MRRRTFIALPWLMLPSLAHAVDYPAVTARVPLAFPRDFGSHPDFRIEWWYLTGQVRDDDGNDFGLQITFFRTRPGVAETGTSAFAPRQLLFAHAALADPRYGRLRVDQRAARAGFGLAEAAEATTDVTIDDWSLARTGDAYVARIAARDFAFALRFTPTQALLPEGDQGYSRKGPRPEQSSYYYSEPQLAVTGSITAGNRTANVTGRAWLDHEWSSEVMAAEAAGWDWTGINFADGGALMAFVMRARSGPPVWGGGTRRDGDGRIVTLRPDEVAFTPQRTWRSPRTQVVYPVAMTVRAGEDTWTLEPLLDDQELDSRGSTGAIYWEGAVRALQSGREAGRGYLELTGYGKPLKL